MSYSIITGNSEARFHVDSNSGVIELRQPLDYEKTQRFTLTVQAEDSTTVFFRKSASATVVINVLDVNDNAPVFAPAVYSSRIDESTTVGSNVLNLSCSDADSGTNGQVKYAIQSGNDDNHFSLDALSGSLSVVGILDFETLPAYTLEVNCSDGGLRSLVSAASVSIVVIGVNEHGANFTSDFTRNYTVAESASPGTEVLQLNATDRDSGSQSSLTFTLIGGDSNNVFRLLSSGLLVIGKELDRETVSQFKLIVSVSDGVYAADVRTLTLLVLDVNDNGPTFDQVVYKASVNEDASIGHSVGTVGAVDRDTGSNSVVSYKITSGNTNNAFHTTSDGHIVTSNNLDYENITVYTLGITVEDEGTPSLSSTTTFIVTVLDVDEYAPEFVGTPDSISVEEGTKIGTLIGTIRTMDLDTGTYGVVTYALTTGNVENTFIINPLDGSLVAGKVLNRAVRSTYRILVVAKSSNAKTNSKYINIYIAGAALTTVPATQSETNRSYETVVNASGNVKPPLSTVDYLTTRIQEYNDHAPKFAASIYLGDVLEGGEPGKTILRISASDEDDGDFGKIFYSLIAYSSKDVNLFSVNNDGFINSRGEYTTGRRYLSVARTEDGASHPLSDTAIVVIDCFSPDHMIQMTFSGSREKIHVLWQHDKLLADLTKSLQREVGTPFIYDIITDGENRYVCMVSYLLNVVSDFAENCVHCSAFGFCFM